MEMPLAQLVRTQLEKVVSESSQGGEDRDWASFADQIRVETRK